MDIAASSVSPVNTPDRITRCQLRTTRPCSRLAWILHLSVVCMRTSPLAAFQRSFSVRSMDPTMFLTIVYKHRTCGLRTSTSGVNPDPSSRTLKLNCVSSCWKEGPFQQSQQQCHAKCEVVMDCFFLSSQFTRMLCLINTSSSSLKISFYAYISYKSRQLRKFPIRYSPY